MLLLDLPDCILLQILQIWLSSDSIMNILKCSKQKLLHNRFIKKHLTIKLNKISLLSFFTRYKFKLTDMFINNTVKSKKYRYTYNTITVAHLIGLNIDNYVRKIHMCKNIHTLILDDDMSDIEKIDNLSIQKLEINNSIRKFMLLSDNTNITKNIEILQITSDLYYRYILRSIITYDKFKNLKKLYIKFTTGEVSEDFKLNLISSLTKSSQLQLLCLDVYEQLFSDIIYVFDNLPCLQEYCHFISSINAYLITNRQTGKTKYISKTELMKKLDL